ncbi:hypothetical protein BHE90_001288 [Fusarium euwallaceae]|uniref:6-phosphogluconate dehydrogenase NADP-binding domain-containing protein n=1 Tax=Fusarium euwallaceae TaxID=1147111 RepID=A0A430M895_9HYPO|nr:hypothetical protein BHE90_001288 [Fusarium euwallaceae]
MGTPMALNLCRKSSVIVWNRNPSKYTALANSGAKIGETPSQVAQQSDFIFTMLFDGAAIQSVIDNDSNFLKAIRGKTLINTSSVSVEFSHKLAQQVREAGGHFIEMPVSGSKIPAEQGQLPITKSAVYCGPIGSGLKVKYAVNLFLVAVTAGLGESMNLARAQGIDLEAFGQVLDNCALASPYSKVKVGKILKEDWSPQAAIDDCYNSTELIKSAARSVQVETPMIALCNSLYKDARDRGLGGEDMMAIYKLFGQSPST